MIFPLLRRFRRGPTRVAVDLTRLGSGGQNGGIKVVAYRFLRWIAETRAKEFSFVYFTRSALVPEIEAFRRDSDWQICVEESEGWPMPAPGARPGLVAARDPSGWLERWPADVLYAPLGFSPFCRAGLPWVSLLVDTLHRDLPDMLPPEEVAFRDRTFGEALRQADAVQCISDFVRGQLERYFGADPSKLFVTHVAVQDRLLGNGTPDRDLRPPIPYFLYPANDWPHKNHPRLLEAFALYRRQKGPGAWDLVLSGHFAQEDRWKDQIASLGLAGSCRLLGHVEPAAFSEAFRQAGALVFPSLYEGFGIPVLEAMALGVPVACSRAGSLPEVAGDAAVFFDPRDAASIAGALQRISEDSGLRRTLSEAGRKRSRQFSIEREAAILADRFRALARQRRDLHREPAP